MTKTNIGDDTEAWLYGVAQRSKESTRARRQEKTVLTKFFIPSSGYSPELPWKEWHVLPEVQNEGEQKTDDGSLEYSYQDCIKPGSLSFMFPSGYNMDLETRPCN